MSTYEREAESLARHYQQAVGFALQYGVKTYVYDREGNNVPKGLWELRHDVLAEQLRRVERKERVR